MAKIELNDTNSGYNLQVINNNFQKIATELNDKVLYRDSPEGEPNEMMNDLDMNGNRVYNLPAPILDHEAARLKDVQDAVAGDITASLVSFEPYKTISSNTVQGAIQELEDDREDFLTRPELADPTGASLVGFKQGVAAARNRTVQDKLRETISILDFPIAADGVTDDRAAIQTAINSLSAGDTLVFPAGYTFKVVNATGTGADLTAQRANAVANSTLYAITSATNNITLQIDGTINATSGLDDLFRFTGAGVRVTGSGTIAGPGVYHDVNSQNPTLQWRPSLVRITGNYSEVEGIRFEDPVTIAIYMLGSFQKAIGNTILGGPLTHSVDGTVMFAIQSGPDNGGGTSNIMSNNFVGRNAAGGAVYTAFMNLSNNTSITDNVCLGVLEHGAYSYGADGVISGNSFSGLSEADPMVAGGIQVFAPGNTIMNNNLAFCQGGVLLQTCSNTVVSGNVMRLANMLGGISIRRYYSEPTTVVYENIVITDNIIRIPGAVQQAIDVALDCNLVGLTITGNSCIGSAATYGAIVVRQFGSANISNVAIDNNFIDGANNFGIEIDNIFYFSVSGNRIINSNAATGNTAILARNNCRTGIMNNNIISDTRATKRIERIILATGTGNNNIRAEGNVGAGLASALIERLVEVPSEGGQLGKNSLNGDRTKGRFSPNNSNGAAVVVTGLRTASGTYIKLNPLNKAAWDLQASANRIFVASFASGYFNWNTSSGAATGTTAAEFEWEVVQ